MRQWTNSPEARQSHCTEKLLGRLDNHVIGRLEDIYHDYYYLVDMEASTTSTHSTKMSI
jgi:hypothetical protein